MKKTINLLILFVFTLDINAQQIFYQDSSELKNFTMQELTGEKYNDPGNKHLNIYFVENWLPGRIVLSNGHEITDLELKFNVANNYLIIRNEKVGQIKADNQIVTDFYLNENRAIYHFKKVKIDTLSATELFCQFIYKSKTELYVYRNVKSVATYNTPEGMRRLYRPKPIYVLLINNKIVLFDKITQKAIYEKFPSLKDKLKQEDLQDHKRIKTENDFFNFLRQVEDVLIELK